ncbi:uncharacterized protein LOC124695994 [Lolium rigidum]|uniref:uncharacterized protein LOC124695994 n=1 Tax=Lolium rigidum TaxID=89674 RepID=UPI001F5DEFA5|nr:uncharacterized protein LOC124695994 [Lolium rigidum]
MDSQPVDVHGTDFYDFGKLVDANLFAADQIWAVYDDVDGMPRLYASRIKHSDALDFKVHLTWLDHVAANEAEDRWTDEELPVACGSFGLRETEISQLRFIFSHIVQLTKGKRRSNYEVYPSKGEVWALYKGWSMQWASDAGNHRSYEYEVVQVLSDFSFRAGVTVVPLVRVKGFSSLFATAKDEPEIVIASSDLLRFSHRVPFYSTDGHEKVDVPRGFLELDPACLPTDLDAAFPPISLDSCMSPGKKENGTSIASSAGSTSSKGKHEDSSSEQNASLLKNCPSKGIFTFPDSEFHDFEGCHSPEKFEHGQIWSICSGADSFPKFYGWISKIELGPFKVCLTWLEACPKVEQEKQWLEQGIPVSCGKLKVRNWRTNYETTNTFSHLVYKVHDPKREIEILPKVGEIWAIYKNWSPDWVPPGTNDLDEYSIGEIVRCTKTKVEGYIAVFKPAIGTNVVKIPVEDKMRFSHRIPSFRLQEEEGGQLYGFHELDPASVPEVSLQQDAPLNRAG